MEQANNTIFHTRNLLNYRDVDATTSEFSNLSSGNVLLTGGYLQGIANVYATTGQYTNLSSGNVLLTGGYLDNTPIGANVISPAGYFTTLLGTDFSTGNAVITGGYADNFSIGANTIAPAGYFTTLLGTNFSSGNGSYDYIFKIIPNLSNDIGCFPGLNTIQYG